MNEYYDLLNKEQQKAYYAMKAGLISLSDSFLVPKLSAKELSDIYFMIRLDDPTIFHSVTFSYKYYPDSTMVELIPEYLFHKDKIREHQKALEARVKKLVRPAKELTEGDKLLYIHDFICQNVKYDKLKKEYSHEMIGPLENGVGVCEGIAKTVKVLCKELGIACKIVISEANPEKGIKYRHAWNVIKIDGQYYHLDATFDNTITKDEVIRYDYVKLSDKQIYRDHEPSIWEIPKCEDGDHFYYKEKKISWTTLEEVEKRTKQAVKKNKVLLFHWRGGFLTQEVLRELIAIFTNTAKEKGKVPVVSVNWSQAVIKARFQEEVEALEKAATQENVTIVDMNHPDYED